MFSLQKQTEFEPGTVKDWPVWDAACHVEGPTPTLLSHAVLIPGRWVRTRALQTAQSPPPPSARHLRASKRESRVLVSSSSHNVGPFLCLPVDKVVQISYS